MFRLDSFNLVELTIRAVAVLLAISIHEMSHGYAAYFLGDKTAKSMGRLSLNPLRHLDPVGALCLLVFGFGWAKPVMINPMYFKKPKRDMALTALAGPFSNFILAFLSLALFKLFFSLPFTYRSFFVVEWIGTFFSTFALLNIGLGVFNLIPIPPLDGSKIFLPLLPTRLYMDIIRYEHLGWIVLIIALGMGVLDPIIGTVGNGILQGMLFLVGGI